MSEKIQDIRPYPNRGYPDLHRDYGWTLGVHLSPPRYQHTWLAVTVEGTYGCWSRREARDLCRAAREGRLDSVLHQG